MATVYKRGDTWWVRFQWRGQEIRRSARTALKGEAREYLEQIMAEYRHVDLGGKQRITFDHAAVAYVEEHVSKKKLSTIKSYQQSLRVLNEEFGKNFLDEITRKSIANFEAKKSRTLSDSKVKHYRAALSGIFKIAMRHDWIERNPCKDLDPIKIDNARYRYLELSEWEELKPQLPEPIRGIAEISVLRGMRLGEILALTWRDINFAQDTITMRDTKSNRPRVIPLEAAGEVLSKLPGGKGPVYPTTTGRHLRVDDVSRRFIKAVNKAGIQDFSFHDLRHTFATWYMQKGGDLYRLQRILGHKGPAMTQRYAHLAVNDLREFPAQNPAQHAKSFLG